MNAVPGNTLITPYIDEMNKELPWGEYPRPQFKRDSYISLNGSWDFHISEECTPCEEYSEKILIPFPPESALSGINRKMPRDKYLIYRRFFTLPEGFVKNRVIIHFGASDQVSTLYINKTKLLTNEGGYLPFSFDITDYLKESDNEVVLAVKDTLSKKYPYGKQTAKRGGMWYTPVSGIWQSVWLESLPENPICSISIEANDELAKIKIETASSKARLIMKESGESFDFSGGEVTVVPSDRRQWSPESPYLYEFTVETETDRVESYFALRKIAIEENRGLKILTLNGKPYLFNGLLDQGYYPDGIFLPATSSGYKDDILAAKKMGFNMLRKHIKIEPMIFYHLCDKLGMIVFQDMVNNSSYSFFIDTVLPTIGIKRLPLRHNKPENQEIFKKSMKETIVHLKNSPSVLQYTIFNEGWGEFRPDEMYDMARSLDPTRVYDATSGWFYGQKSDFDSRHIYFKKIKVKSPSLRPLFISEFGGYSYRVDSHVFGKDNYGYKLFKSARELEDAIEQLYLNEVCPLIDKGLSALVYTQLTDVEDETNGLLTYDRQMEKVSCDKMKSINNELYRRFREFFVKK